MDGDVPSRKQGSSGGFGRRETKASGAAVSKYSVGRRISRLSLMLLGGTKKYFLETHPGKADGL